jgi:WhiB family transcriptional regulator, redox-sensing transcriptional regulator
MAERYDAWMSWGSCKTMDPEIFFPTPPRKGVSPDYRRAKAICLECPVKNICLAYAIVHREKAGVWGTKSPPERRAVPRPVKQRFREIWPELVRQMRAST